VNYEFTLVIEGLDLDDDDQGNALFDAGCDDATFGEVDGRGYADFHRDAGSLTEALISAIRNVESVPGLRVVHSEPDELVTAAEIADRLGKSKEYIRLLANGERGGGAFPAPVSHMRTRNRLWRWPDVAAWAGVVKPNEVHDAYVLAAVNAMLDLRQLRTQVPDEVKHLASALELELSGLS
jgi:hypothetical protein